jgi:hypothetical protein
MKAKMEKSNKAFESTSCLYGSASCSIDNEKKYN